jgi:hypothetical protein
MTNDFASQNPSFHTNHQVNHQGSTGHAYSGFLSILSSLCSLPYLALRAVVDFFAPPSAFELAQRQHRIERIQALAAEFASKPAGLSTQTSTDSPATQLPIDSRLINETSLHTLNTMKKIATNDRPTLTSAKKTLKTGLTMQHGRIIISGRMADVCAELERLAALEAASA